MQDQYAGLVVGCSVIHHLFETLTHPPTLGITGKRETITSINWLVVLGRWGCLLYLACAIDYTYLAGTG